jgi:alkylation response protein AidB-like acyl-CoA dehydrogenase
VQDVASESDRRVSAEDTALIEAAAALRPVIRGYQAEIERERRLPPALVAQLRAAGLYRMFVPRELGGAQVDVLTFFRVIELAAEGDGSVGWNLATNAIASSAVLSLPREGTREIFGGGPDVICAGTIGTRGGRAVPVDGGYVVTGRWPFGSGCREADWMVGCCQVFDGDELRRQPDGSPELWRVVFPAAECTVLDTWDVIGMRGTGSHDWTVEEVFVPRRRAQRFTTRWTQWPGTLYALPPNTYLGNQFSSVATGIARAGVDTLTELAGSKVPYTTPGLLREQAQVQEWVGRAEALLGAARAYRTAAVGDAWATVAAGRPATLEQEVRCRLAACHAADSAIQAMDLMYRAGGTTGIARDHPLARCWRDLHVVGQTFQLLPEYYMLGGRVFLGLDPGPKLSR